jgi:hypothetical protein
MRRIVGAASVLLAVIAAVADGFAVGSAVGRNDQLSSAFVVVALFASILAIAAGVFALVTHRGRLLGVLGASLGLLANPFVLVAVLGFFARFASN